MRHTPWMGTAALVGLLAAAALLAGYVALPAKADAPAWEYHQVRFHGDYDQLEETLATAGADGYELVLISPQETVAIFKRPQPH